MISDKETAKARSFLKNALEVGIRLGLLLLLVLWCFEIVRPFIVPIIWGIIIAVAIYPGYRRLSVVLGDRRVPAATLCALLMLVVFIGPTIMLAGTLLETAQGFAKQLSQGKLQIPPPPESVGTWPLIGESLENIWSLASVNLGAALARIGPQIKVVGRWLLSATGGVSFGILQFVFAIVISGVLLAYSKSGSLTTQAIAARLMGGQGQKLVDLAHATVRSVTRGILGVALIQAILAGLGFLVVGIPGAGLLALLCLFLAVVQVGIALISIPAAIYMFVTADTLTAVLFLIWIVFVTLIDNVLKPLLLGRGSQVPAAVIFLGAIGGLLAHGFIGLFVGSVVLAIGYTLFRAWLLEKTAPVGRQSGPEPSAVMASDTPPPMTP